MSVTNENDYATVKAEVIVDYEKYSLQCLIIDYLVAHGMCLDDWYKVSYEIVSYFQTLKAVKP